MEGTREGQEEEEWKEKKKVSKGMSFHPSLTTLLRSITHIYCLKK